MKQSSIARSLSISRQAVNQHIQKLKERGYIRVRRQARENGSETSCRYEIVYVTSLQDQLSPLCKPVFQGVQVPELSPPASSGACTHNNSIEHLNNISLLQKAVSLYNHTAEKASLPIARRLTESRQKKLQARLAECGGLAGWEEALRKVEASDFCAGRKTDFRADLDFLLQPQSFLRLLEGRYDNPDNRNGPKAGETPQRRQQENQRLMDELMEDDRS